MDSLSQELIEIQGYSRKESQRIDGKPSKSRGIRGFIPKWYYEIRRRKEKKEVSVLIISTKSGILQKRFALVFLETFYVNPAELLLLNAAHSSGSCGESGDKRYFLFYGSPADRVFVVA